MLDDFGHLHINMHILSPIIVTLSFTCILRHLLIHMNIIIIIMNNTDIKVQNFFKSSLHNFEQLMSLTF